MTSTSNVKTMTTAALLSPSMATTYLAQKHGLKVSPRTVRRWARIGAVPALRGSGGRLYVKAGDLDGLFKS